MRIIKPPYRIESDIDGEAILKRIEWSEAPEIKL